MADQIDIREVSGCTCLRVRRIARRLTQSYDRALEPVELTVNQFGILAKLHGASLKGRHQLSVGALADLIGKHPTTLNRDLKLLRARGLVADASEPKDRRVRAVLITDGGRHRLKKAIPYWRKAQRELEAALGVDMARSLNDVLDFAISRLAL